jgi:hypothetical protein
MKWKVMVPSEEVELEINPAFQDHVSLPGRFDWLFATESSLASSPRRARCRSLNSFFTLPFCLSRGML